VTKELATFLTELYVIIDDHLVESRRGRGRRPGCPTPSCPPASPNDYWAWPPDLAQLDHRSNRKRSLTAYDH
jgi:hypothetical protein